MNWQKIRQERKGWGELGANRMLLDRPWIFSTLKHSGPTRNLSQLTFLFVCRHQGAFIFGHFYLFKGLIFVEDSNIQKRCISISISNYFIVADASFRLSPSCSILFLDIFYLFKGLIFEEDSPWFSISNEFIVFSRKISSLSWRNILSRVEARLTRSLHTWPRLFTACKSLSRMIYKRWTGYNVKCYTATQWFIL